MSTHSDNTDLSEMSQRPSTYVGLCLHKDTICMMIDGTAFVLRKEWVVSDLTCKLFRTVRVLGRSGKDLAPKTKLSTCMKPGRQVAIDDEIIQMQSSSCLHCHAFDSLLELQRQTIDISVEIRGTVAIVTQPDMDPWEISIAVPLAQLATLLQPSVPEEASAISGDGSGAVSRTLVLARDDSGATIEPDVSLNQIAKGTYTLMVRDDLYNMVLSESTALTVSLEPNPMDFHITIRHRGVAHKFDIGIQERLDSVMARINTELEPTFSVKRIQGQYSNVPLRINARVGFQEAVSITFCQREEEQGDICLVIPVQGPHDKVSLVASAISIKETSSTHLSPQIRSSLPRLDPGSIADGPRDPALSSSRSGSVKDFGASPLKSTSLQRMNEGRASLERLSSMDTVSEASLPTLQLVTVHATEGHNAMQTSCPSRHLVWSDDLLSDIFPFYMRITEGGDLISCGRSIAKLFGATRAEMEGQSCDTLFTPIRPTLPLKLAARLPLTSLSTVIQCNNWDAFGKVGKRPRLVGQIVVIEGKENGEMLFLGTMQTQSEQDIMAFGLTLNDFGVNDNSLKAMVLTHNAEAAVSHSASLVGALNMLRYEKERNEDLLAELHSQYRELEAASSIATESTRLKSEFVATLSHELRTPLHVMMGMTELLQSTTLDADQTEYVTGIDSGAEVLLRIVNTVLDLSKIESGKLELDLEEFNIQQSCEDVLNLFKFTMEKSGLDLHFFFDSDLHVAPLITTDRKRIQQVLLNLLGNAAKFTHEGDITLRVQVLELEQREPVEGSQPLVLQDGEEMIEIRFEVQDTGIGVAESDINRIFLPFQQADSTDTRKYGGTGLGLSICTQLVALMDGRIWAESTLGQGTTVIFTIRAKRRVGQEQASITRDIRTLIEAPQRTPGTPSHDSSPQVYTFAPPTVFGDGSRELLLICDDPKTAQIFIHSLALWKHDRRARLEALRSVTQPGISGHTAPPLGPTSSPQKFSGTSSSMTPAQSLRSEASHNTLGSDGKGTILSESRRTRSLAAIEGVTLHVVSLSSLELPLRKAKGQRVVIINDDPSGSNSERAYSQLLQPGAGRPTTLAVLCYEKRKHMFDQDGGEVLKKPLSLTRILAFFDRTILRPPSVQNLRHGNDSETPLAVRSYQLLTPDPTRNRGGHTFVGMPRSPLAVTSTASMDSPSFLQMSLHLARISSMSTDMSPRSSGEQSLFTSRTTGTGESSRGSVNLRRTSKKISQSVQVPRRASALKQRKRKQRDAGGIAGSPPQGAHSQGDAISAPGSPFAEETRLGLVERNAARERRNRHLQSLTVPRDAGTTSSSVSGDANNDHDIPEEDDLGSLSEFDLDHLAEDMVEQSNRGTASSGTAPAGDSTSAANDGGGKSGDTGEGGAGVPIGDSLCNHPESVTSADSDMTGTTVTTEPQRSRPLALVVDDHGMNCIILQKMCAALGVDTVVEMNGRLGVDRWLQHQLDKNPFDIVLMDCQMPVMDGYLATQTIRELEAESGWSAVYIVAVTADSTPSVSKQCADFGMNAVLLKPANKAAIKACLVTAGTISE
eukprot:TRINITY_DN1446_c0_g1_i2.p1 TRINITY_DN1446_c0_g1~~TRINITY_DN1446_c0_g1_i2.p1  ORF type:complete len:1550 (+),score=216.69 TRINITY_DN1446_c0_g1_i2:147-4796(+)